MSEESNITMEEDRDTVEYFNPDGVANSVLHINRSESLFSRFFYQMQEEYQITYESASGIGPDDSLNVLTLSGDSSFLSKEPVEMHNRAFRSDILHYHDYYELMIVLEGTVINHIEGRDYTYPAGSACLINRGLRHAEGFASACRLLFIGLSPDYVRGLETEFRHSVIQAEKSVLDGPVFAFIRQDLAEPGSRNYLDFIPAQQNTRPYRILHDITEDLLKTLLTPFCGSTAIVRGRIAQILSLLSSGLYHCSNIASAMNKDYLLFSRVTRLIEENDGRISRKELEQLTNYSGDYLNRIVKKYSGRSLYDYGMFFCMMKAAEYLRQSTLSVGEIASRCGFTNKTHFYRRFEASFHMTPNAYRQESMRRKKTED